MSGKVMHARLFPRENRFAYSIYYIACPLDRLDSLKSGFLFTLNRPGLLSFYDRDHGDKSGRNLKNWIKDILKQYGLDEITSEITLVAMPRVLGYVFNPVSFWLCRDKQGALRAVLCEVNNTFGEQHSYLCAHDDKRAIQPDDTLQGQKVFHVSPFLPREGAYTFRFNIKDAAFGVWIDFYDSSGKKQLLTSLTGRMAPFTTAAIGKHFLTHPLVTFTAVWRIHWQAFKLVAKGIKYIPKPRQRVPNVTTGGNVKKM